MVDSGYGLPKAKHPLSLYTPLPKYLYQDSAIDIRHHSWYGHCATHGHICRGN